MSKTTTEEPQMQTIAIESMQIGHRYVAVIGPEWCDGWTVASVERHTSKLEVLRNGEWVAPELVTVTYNNGQSITHEVGTAIAIDNDAH